MDSPLERRLFNRLIVNLRVDYHTRHPETDETHQGRGTIRNISPGGSFFHADSAHSFQPGQLVSLTIRTPLPYPEAHDLSCFKATGEVVRVEPPDNHDVGVAVRFLEGPAFCKPSSCSDI